MEYVKVKLGVENARSKVIINTVKSIQFVIVIILI